MKPNFLQQIIEQWLVRMRRAKLRQKELAQLAGISETYLSLIFSGKKTNPKIKTLDKIEAALTSRGV